MCGARRARAGQNVRPHFSDSGHRSFTTRLRSPLLGRLRRRTELRPGSLGNVARKILPLSADEFLARVRAAGPATDDDVSVTLDGRRLDSKEAVLAWLAEVEAERAAGRFAQFDDD